MVMVCVMKLVFLVLICGLVFFEKMFYYVFRLFSLVMFCDVMC